MDDIAALVAQARIALAIAHARLVAARRVRWEGVHGRVYTARLDEAAARVTALTGHVDAASAAVGPPP
ncbi:hypothetical protein [Demequina soli]|uniref:hypothetical protein n=1 Tax=Demequina soli TaxID=1638987 RepID=UPI00078244B2|nr:hypothetical protein [Demequina soli]